MAAPPASGDADDPGSTAWFIEHYGLINANQPRTAGRLFALLLVESGPFSFAELAERLQVSRASISINTRMLEQGGMIERVSRPGDRQDYYQVVRNPWARVLERQIADQRRAKEYADTLLSAQPDLPGEVRRRIEELVSLIDEACRSMSVSIERLSAPGKAGGQED